MKTRFLRHRWLSRLVLESYGDKFRERAEKPTQNSSVAGADAPKEDDLAPLESAWDAEMRREIRAMTNVSGVAEGADL